MGDWEVLPLLGWVEEHEAQLLPPVCNKLMHGGQLKIMVVGGPNVREDYHIEEGEELFYMLKGDMCLNVMEKGVQRPIHIKEGEVFVLPARIPHSPQRVKDSIGIVIERHRREGEMDCLRYYCDGSAAVLWERWFHCIDLGTQLKPLIEEYFSSEEHRSRKPTTGANPSPPFEVDTESALQPPISLREAIANSDCEDDKSVTLIDTAETTVTAVMNGAVPVAPCETWIWQWAGTSAFRSDSEESERLLDEGDTLLVPPNSEIELAAAGLACTTLVIRQWRQ